MERRIKNVDEEILSFSYVEQDNIDWWTAHMP